MNISVVIPCYNGEKFIVEAIESINSQTYPPFEIVIVDDGSSDKTALIINELRKSSTVPLVVVTQINHGVSAARNVGVGVASGDWVAFLDVDDIWLPDMLQKKVDAINKFNMTSGLICCNYYVDEQIESAMKHNDSALAKAAHDRLLTGPEFQKSIIRENFVGTASVMMFSRIDALRIGCFDCFLKHSEDFDFLLRFSNEYDVLILSESLALKRHHGANLTDDKELYYYSHALSCFQNLQYKPQYSRSTFNKENLKLLRVDADKFTTGYCNQVYERQPIEGIGVYVKSFLFMNSIKGLKNHSLGFVKKLIRSLSLGLIKNKQQSSNK